VTERAAATPAEAARHHARVLALETDCWDVREALKLEDPGFVLIDTRSPEAFAEAHVRGAVNLPHSRINERTLEAYDRDTLFVVYCWGPQCNGADKAALRLAQLGRPVKKMIGGVWGWRENGFEFAQT
jgi:rhodanese-related sulfurtransferase